MTLQTRLGDFITAVGTDYKNIKTWIFGSTSGSLSDLTTTNKTGLVPAVNELKAAIGAGSPTTLDDLTDVTLTSPATANILRFNGSQWVNVVGTTYFDAAGAAATAQAASQPLNSNLTAIGGLTPTDGDVIQRVSGSWVNRTMAQLKTSLGLTKSDVGLGSVDNLQQLPMSYLDTDITLAANSDTKVPSQKGVKSYIDTAVSGATIPDATTSVKGKVELATDAETITGTDTVRAITPSNLAASWLDRIDPSTSLGTSNTKVPSQNAAKTYIDALLDAANALVYKGVIDASTNPNWPAANAGYMYLVSVAGKMGGASGQVVEAGDMLICKTDSSAAGNDATVGANWNIIQKNIDGVVTGPASSTSGDIATFSGTGGKVVQDSGVAISTDGTLASNVDTKIPTEKAVKAYSLATHYTKTELGDPETDLAAAYATAKS